MSDSADWLDIEEPEVEEENNWLAMAKTNLPGKAEFAYLTPVTPRFADAFELPADRKQRNEMIKEAWGKLKPTQQGFLYAWARNKFNARATIRALKGTVNQISARAVDTWVASNKDFQFIMKVMRGVAAEAATDPDRLHLLVDEIAESALEGEDILFNGVATGYKKKHFADALRAIEIQMKAKQMFKDEGPTAIAKVQIVRLTGDWESGETIDGETIVSSGEGVVDYLA